MALKFQLLGKFSQHNHHNHSVQNCKDCMTPEDVGVSYQVRYCSGPKRILDWFWKVKKKKITIYLQSFSPTLHSNLDDHILHQVMKCNPQAQLFNG